MPRSTKVAPVLIDTLLDARNLSSVFQPIVRLSPEGPRLHALECLTRGTEGSHFESAEVMFEYVRCMAAEPRMDLLCIEKALEAAAAFPPTTQLSINVHMATLSRMAAFPDELERRLSRAEVSPRRVILELTEHGVLWLNRTVHVALDHFREIGMTIALDDVGSGNANLGIIVDLRPEVLKIDRGVVHGLAADPWRRAAVESVVSLAKQVGIGVVAEGVATSADLDGVKALGIELVQGFLLARPQPAGELLGQPLLT
jgi:EAL domain-containing protein (putative c-di-GMP-specific phosphodiesterase class I)